jgi:hypothetical protein
VITRRLLPENKFLSPSVLKTLFAGCSKKISEARREHKWSVGVMEYWSIASRTHHSTTPSLHYSSPDDRRLP